MSEIRLSPFADANGVHDSNRMASTARGRSHRPGGLAYLHVVEGKTGGPRDAARPEDLAALRARFHGAWIGNNGYTRALAIDNVETGKVDLVAFGKLYIANPDSWSGSRRTRR